MKIIKRIIRNILSKFNLPKMDISDKEYEESLKEYIDKVGRYELLEILKEVE